MKRLMALFFLFSSLSATENFHIPIPELGAINILGAIESGELLQLSPKMDGELIKIHHELGEHVQHNTTVYEYINPEAQEAFIALTQQYKHELNQLKSSDNKREELNELLKIGALSPMEHQSQMEALQYENDQFKNTEHRFKTMCRQFNITHDQINEIKQHTTIPEWMYRTITLSIPTPIDGVIVPVHGHKPPALHTTIKEHSPISTVANYKKLSATFMVPTDYLSFLHVKQDVHLTVLKKNTPALKGTIRSIAYPLNDPSPQAQYPVVIDIENHFSESSSVFGSNIKLTIDPKSQIKIPKDTITWAGKQAFVTLSVKGKWIEQPVELTPSTQNESFVLVSHGLQPGATVKRHVHY